MDTSVQNTNLTEDELTVPVLEDQDADLAEAEEAAHIHLPNGSLWPLLLGLAILVTMIGFAIINTTPWVTIIGAVFVLVGILGWASENPNASHEEVVEPGKYAATFAEAAKTGKPTPLAEIALQEAEEALRKLPGVLDVMNFLVAEDELLNAVNAVIENLKAQGKLEGAKNLSALVENYIVSLYGEVPKPEMKYLLEREITAIPGARVVINHIGVNEDIPGNVGRTSNRIARI